MGALPTSILGRTGIEVTRLGYGAMELRGLEHFPRLSAAEASALLNAVLDSGINYIDTSPDYGYSEELIGRHIAHRRGEYFLASKCGCPQASAAVPWSRPMSRTSAASPTASPVRTSAPASSRASRG